MKLFLFILLSYSSSYSQSQEKIPPKTQDKIEKGIDYYNLSLYEDSKKYFLTFYIQMKVKNMKPKLDII